MQTGVNCVNMCHIAGILPVLGGVLPLAVVQDGELGILERAHDVLEQHPSAQ